MAAEAADALKHSPQLWALLMELIQALKFLTQAGRWYSVTVQRYHLPFIHKGYVLPTHTRSLKSYTVIKELANLSNKVGRKGDNHSVKQVFGPVLHYTAAHAIPVFRISFIIHTSTSCNIFNRLNVSAPLPEWQCLRTSIWTLSWH